MMVKAFMTDARFKVNSYLVHEGKRGVVIDPGKDCERLLLYAKEQDLDISCILITHGHVDHVSGNRDALAAFPCDLLMAGADLSLYESVCKLWNLDKGVVPTRFLKDGDVIDAGFVKIGAVATPGHTSGSITFFADDAIFLGDLVTPDRASKQGLILANDAVRASIRSILPRVSSTVTLYPGHGPPIPAAELMGWVQEHE